MNFSQEFKKQISFRIEESHSRILACLDLLDESQIWLKPNTVMNSMGNLVLHLCGNITQYVMSTLAGGVDQRNRDAEFAATGGIDKETLKKMFHEVIVEALKCIEQCSEADLLIPKKVQIYELSGIGIMVHVTEHLSYHTGQASSLTKLLLEKDLGYYAGYDLNKKHPKD